MINNRDQYLIAGWMVNDLGLSGIRLIIYAIIYNSSQDGKSTYTLNLPLLSTITGESYLEIDKFLQSLIRRKLIQEVSSEDNKIKYRAL